MSEYDKFFGNPVDVEIAGVKCQMKPLTVADISLLSKLDKPEEKNDAIKKVLMKTLVPEITSDEVDKIAIQFFPKIMETIMEINGLNTELQKDKIPEEGQ